MDNYDNDNKLAIWENENRESERHPHYKGSGMVNGVEVWVSGWINESENPRAPALKLSITPKTDVAQQGAANTRAATGLRPVPVQRPAAAMPDGKRAYSTAVPDAAFDDDIPF